MDIYKIALLGIISAILIMALKDQVPVFTVVISIIAGILIILYILPQIKEIVLEIENLIRLCRYFEQIYKNFVKSNRHFLYINFFK